VLEEISTRCRAQQVYGDDENFLPSLKLDHPELATLLDDFSAELAQLQGEISEVLVDLHREPRAHGLEGAMIPRIQRWLVRVDENQRQMHLVLDQAFGRAE
jgi:hypothetical protein